MAFYSYTAVNSDGTLIKGAMEGSDIETVRDTIASFGLYVITLRRLSHYNSHIRKWVLTRSVRRPEIIEFARNLSVMLKAGIPILKALSDIADGLENKYLQQTLNSMRRKIEFGSSFSDAAACFNVFPDSHPGLSHLRPAVPGRTATNGILWSAALCPSAPELPAQRISWIRRLMLPVCDASLRFLKSS